MSPLGSAFTTRLRMFPGLVNNCTIDWFTEWPEVHIFLIKFIILIITLIIFQEALIGVGKGQLQEYEEELQIEGKVDVLVEMFKTMHKSVEKISERFLA